MAENTIRNMDDAQDVVHRVVRVERNAIERGMTRLRFWAGLDFHAIGVVGTHFVQRHDVRHHQAQQHQRHSDHVEAEEAVERGVAHHVVAADQQRQVRTDEGNGREQVHDHLRTPVGHLAPRQQVAHEGFGHQHQEDGATEHPHQFARLAVRTVDQATEHVQVHDHEEGGSSGGVHVADQPAPGHIAHDVLDRSERHRHARRIEVGVWLVVHHQKDAGHDLDHQHQQRQRAEDVPEVEVLRRVVLGQVLACRA
jgi:hypothetical protein